jgi:sterol desaturase/sphingolipid hydroxylase (fatty acid hydroxylase superfamily)
LALREKFPRTEPLWRVLERYITLPDTHHAHHAYGKGAHPNGNYAVTLFVFDRWFGTAKIPNQRQRQFGLPISKRLHWAEELLWPLVRKPLLPKPPVQTK